MQDPVPLLILAPRVQIDRVLFAEVTVHRSLRHDTAQVPVYRDERIENGLVLVHIRVLGRVGVDVVPQRPVQELNGFRAVFHEKDAGVHTWYPVVLPIASYGQNLWAVDAVDQSLDLGGRVHKECIAVNPQYRIVLLDQHPYQPELIVGLPPFPHIEHSVVPMPATVRLFVRHGQFCEFLEIRSMETAHGDLKCGRHETTPTSAAESEDETACGSPRLVSIAEA